MAKKSKKIIWWTVAVIIVLFVSCRVVKSKKSSVQHATTVRLETLVPGQLQEYVSAPGQIGPKTKVMIIARVSACIEELPIKEGQTVKAGDIVVRLDSKEYASRLKNTEAAYKAQEAQLGVTKAQICARKAQLKGTEASLEQARKDFERQKQLLESHDISQSTFEQAQQKYEEMQAQYESSTEQIKADEMGLTVTEYNLDAMKAQIEEAREALEYTIMRSPIDGVVTRTYNEVGEMVTGSMNYSGTTIMSIADMSHMLLVANVDEADIGKVSIGQNANIRVKAFWEDTYHGKVTHIELVNGASGNTTNYSSDSTNFYQTEILIEGDVSKFYTGLTADVDIFTRKHTDILKVPSQAVMARRAEDLPMDIRNNPLVDPNKIDATIVFRYVDKKAIATPVKIGPGDTTHIIIEDGLKAGDQIIIGPYKVLDSLRHDQAVEDEKEAEAKKSKDKTDKKSEPAAKTA